MKKSTIYAIVDIETTGGFAAKNNITEIAILLIENGIVIKEFHSLINPLIKIPFYISQLTGIKDEMVANAPTFDEIADQIYDLLRDSVFVAHNVIFDFSFIHHNLKKLGYVWNPVKLCTVRLSRQIFPNLNSYSLGKLCTSLNIQLENRHRAFGDASATAILFKELLKNDDNGLILKMQKKNLIDVKLPNHFDPENFNQLPNTYGVYLFRDKANKVVYIGKANNLKKRVQQHFSGNNITSRRQSFLNEIYSVDFIETGSEIMALLEEAKLIKHYWPKFNSALKRFEPKFDIISYQDQNKFLRLTIVKHQKNNVAIKSYDRVYDATNSLLNTLKNNELNPMYCRFYNQEKFDNQIIEDINSKFHNESLTAHNHKFYLAMDEIIGQSKSYVIKVNGRNSSEYGYILVKDDLAYSFGFIDKDVDVNTYIASVPNKDRCVSSYYMCKIINSYKERFPDKVFDII